MSDFTQFVALSEAAAHFPGRPHIGTLIRWALKGVGQHRVKLQTWKVGGRRYTTQEAIERFVAQLSGEVETVTTASGKRAEEMVRAGEVLDADGIRGDGAPILPSPGGRQKGFK